MGRLLNYMLGNSTSPMAGDGYGIAPTPARSSISGSSDYFGSNKSRTSSMSTLQSRSQLSSNTTTNEAEEGSLQEMESKSNSLGPIPSPLGVRAPTSPLATTASVTASGRSPRPSIDSFRTASEASIIDDNGEITEKVPWERYEIPSELEVTKNGTPDEICSIVQESMEEQRAMWVSRMQSAAFDLQDQCENPSVTNEEIVYAGRATMASARSTPDGGFKSSSPTTPPRSPMNQHINVNINKPIQPPSQGNGESASTSSRDSPEDQDKPTSAVTAMERRFLESKLQSKKSYGLFSLLSSRKARLESSQVITTMSECTSCFDDIPNAKAVSLPCRHKYCSPCFTQLVTTSIQHEVNFPPKCCLTDIPKKIIRDNLPPVECARFEEKALEYAVPVGNRYYCISSTCGRWIDTRHARYVPWLSLSHDHVVRIYETGQFSIHKDVGIRWRICLM